MQQITKSRAAVILALLVSVMAVSGCENLNIKYEPVNLNVWKESGIDR